LKQRLGRLVRTTSCNRVIFTLAIAAIMLDVALAAENALLVPPEVSTLVPSVSSVATGGYWEQGGKRGSYRVIVLNIGWERIRSSVWIQWIEENAAEQSLRVAATVAVSEIGNLRWSVGVPELVPSKTGTIVRLKAVETHSLRDVLFELSLGEVGRYRCIRCVQ